MRSTLSLWQVCDMTLNDYELALIAMFSWVCKQ